MPISKDQFCQDYYDLALNIANMEIRKLNYFAYGASDTLCHDAAVHALDVCHARYDGQRASLKTYMGTIIHNKLVDLISKENRYILTDFEVRNPGEGDYDQSREEELLSYSNQQLNC